MIVFRSTLEGVRALLKAEQQDNQRLRIANARLEAHADLAEHNMGEMRKLYDALLEKYHELKASGAAAHRGLDPVQRPSKPADIAIEEQVERRGGGDRLRRVLRAFVHSERMKESADEEAIASRVRKWSDPSDEEAA